MNVKTLVVWVIALSLTCVVNSVPGQDLGGGMLDPAIDLPGEPFSYFSNPTDVIGALFAPVASEVTPEGYVYNGFGSADIQKDLSLFRK